MINFLSNFYENNPKLFIFIITVLAVVIGLVFQIKIHIIQENTYYPRQQRKKAKVKSWISLNNLLVLRNKYYVEKYVKEAKKDIKELEELESEKQ